MKFSMNTAQSLGAKLTLVCAICVVVTAVVAAMINQALVRKTRDQMLELSEQLAEQKGKQLADELRDTWRDAQRLERLQGGVRTASANQLRFKYTEDDQVQWAILAEDSPDGINVLYSYFRDPETQQEVMNTQSATLAEGETLEIAGRNGGKWEVSLDTSNTYRIPLNEIGHPGLNIIYKIQGNLQEIEAAGREITRLVASMAAMLCAALALSFLVVWGLFRGQMRLFRENEKLNRMAYVGTLASGLAHEIRNPLNAMSVNLGVIEEDLQEPVADSPGRMEKIVHRLQTEVQQLDGVVTNFLAYAMPGAGSRERLRLSEPAREALAALEEEFRRYQVKTEIALNDDLIVEGDPVGLRQVFQNLAQNALEAMRDSARRQLTLRGWREDGRARVMCRDTGMGISSHSLPRIFEAFHSGKPGGSGFGLSIAKRIVESHGGRIWAESQPGAGATFYLDFPLPSPRRRD